MYEIKFTFSGTRSMGGLDNEKERKKDRKKERKKQGSKIQACTRVLYLFSGFAIENFCMKGWDLNYQKGFEAGILRAVKLEAWVTPMESNFGQS